VKLFRAYKILAFVVGTLLVALTLGMVLKYLFPEGGTLQSFGEQFTPIVAVGHGYLYMAYVVVAFFLSLRAGWKLSFLGLLLVSGLVPVLIFFVERKVEARLRAENPELVSS
jgi:integral membrane protein